MNEINWEEPIGDREGTARWGEARSGVCGDTEIKKGHFTMEGKPYKKTKRCLLDVSARIHYNFDLGNFWKQKLEAKMHRVEKLGRR